MTCPVCSFENGHYVCSRAPVISLAEKLEKENKEILAAAKVLDGLLAKGANALTHEDLDNLRTARMTLDREARG